LSFRAQGEISSATTAIPAFETFQELKLFSLATSFLDFFLIKFVFSLIMLLQCHAQRGRRDDVFLNIFFDKAILEASQHGHDGGREYGQGILTGTEIVARIVVDFP
jgi:hypothetical protein